jgi:hypothetical protein
MYLKRKEIYTKVFGKETSIIFAVLQHYVLFMQQMRRRFPWVLTITLCSDLKNQFLPNGWQHLF